MRGKIKMIISPKLAVEEGWITIDNDEQIQPNAVEFTLDVVHSINKDAIFKITSKRKEHRGTELLMPHYNETGDYWVLDPSSVYDGMSSTFIKVPDNIAVLLIIRSTFSRNGIFLTSGLYDSGFSGNVGFGIHNKLGPAHIEVGIRFGQAIFMTADSVGKYAGGYNHKDGTHWT